MRTVIIIEPLDGMSVEDMIEAMHELHAGLIFEARTSVETVDD